MSIDRLMKKVTKDDTAVYWANPVVSADGSFTFDTPVEVNCFWNDVNELIRTDDGREVVSRAKVYVVQDLDDKGMLFHGKLTDLTTAQKNDPRTVDNAYEVKKIMKVPSIRVPGEFSRVVMV